MRKLAAVLLCAVLLPACGLGEREGFADRVAGSTTRAIGRKTVAGTLAASLRIAKAPIELPPEATDQHIDISTPFVADLGAHRSILTDQHLVHDDLVLDLRRADAEENDARPWLTLDLDDLNDDASLPFSNSNPIRMPYTVFAVPPTVLVDLISGALTGSLEALGTKDIEGTAVRGYRANFDLEKMLNDARERAYDDDRRDAVKRSFEALDIDESVHPGRVWIDGGGLPRRFQVTFDEVPRPRWVFEVTVTIDFLEWGVDAAFDLPTAEETIRISSITRLMTELARSFPQPTRPTVTAATPPSTVPSEQPAPEEDVTG